MAAISKGVASARAGSQPRALAHAAFNVVGIQSWDRVNGTKFTRIMERIRVSLGAIFSITVSCGGVLAGPRGMTSRPPTLSCSISGGGTCKCVVLPAYSVRIRPTRWRRLGGAAALLADVAAFV